MVADPNFLNPLNNPIFFDIAKRFVWVFIVGFFLILILNKFSFRGLWQGNLGKRYLSWLIIGSLYIAAVFFGGVPSLIFLAGIMILALNEVCRIAKLPKAYFYTLSILAIISVMTASYFENRFYMLPLLFFSVLTTLTIRRNDKKGFGILATSFYASIWIIFFLSHFILLGHLNNEIDKTKALLFMIGFAVPLADIGAYIFGRMLAKIDFLNRFKIASNISPKKIWAGVLGDVVGAGMGIWIMSFALKNYFSILEMVLLALVIGFFSVMGDMTESLVKRYFNVKDSGELIPGHGGILDRIDSVIRVIVVVYVFSLIFLGN